MESKIEYVNTSNLTKEQENAIKYAMKHINTNPVKVSGYYKALKSWIKLVTINQLKIMHGENLLKPFLDDELFCISDNRAKELYIDSVIVAYQKNLYEGLYIKDKVYYMLPNEHSFKSQIFVNSRNLLK